MLKLLGATIFDFYNALSNLGSIFFIEIKFFKENSLNKRLVFLHRCIQVIILLLDRECSALLKE